MKELLKSVKLGVEQIYGSTICYAKDCQLLGDDIIQKTGRQISTSTLKRFFGIISSPFNPSAYTLDTLVNYIGFENWREYVNSFQMEKHDDSKDTWHKLAERVDILTSSSLENMKRKIGSHCKGLINRKNILHTFNEFYRSDDNVLLLVAPDGYGKSTSVVQFYNMLESLNNVDNNICCIIEGSMFYHKLVDYKDNSLLKQLVDFNLNTSLNEYFRVHSDQIKGHFIVVIDDVDEVFLDKERYHLFVGNLMKIIQAYINMPWFKLVLTCRPENLKPFDYFLQKNPVLLDTCSPFFKTQGDRINVPLFSDSELNDLLKQRNKGIDLSYVKFYYSDLLTLVRYPFFVDVIFDAISENRDISEISIISRSLVNKIYDGPYGEEKHALIESFLNLCQLGRENTVIPKSELLRSSSRVIAYNELLASGIIYEKVVYDKYIQKASYVEFTQKVLLEYFIAINWIKSYQLNIELFKAVEDYYAENRLLKCGVFKWLVKLVFESEDVNLIKDLHTFAEAESFEFNGRYKVPCYGKDMAEAIKIKLRQSKALRDELLPYFASTPLGQFLYYEHYFDVDSLMLYDIEYIDDYLQHCVNYKSKLSALFLKFMHAFFDNDLVTCEDAYNVLSEFDVPDSIDVGLYFRYYAVVILYKDMSESCFPHQILEEAIRNLNKQSDTRNLTKIYIRLLFVMFFTSEPNVIIDVYEQLSTMSSWSKQSSGKYLKLFHVIYADALQKRGDTLKAVDVYNKALLLESPDVKSLFIKMCQMTSELEVELSLSMPVDSEKQLQELYQISKLLNNNYFIDKLKYLTHKDFVS